jgi:hypothetical protein
MSAVGAGTRVDYCRDATAIPAGYHICLQNVVRSFRLFYSGSASSGPELSIR